MQPSAAMSPRRSLAFVESLKSADDFVDRLSFSSQFRKDFR